MHPITFLELEVSNPKDYFNCKYCKNKINRNLAQFCIECFMEDQFGEVTKRKKKLRMMKLK